MANRNPNERQTLRTFYGMAWRFALTRWRFLLTLSVAVWLLIMVSAVADWPVVAVVPVLLMLVIVVSWFYAAHVIDPHPPEHTASTESAENGTPTE